jgi:hypothetical protein
MRQERRDVRAFDCLSESRVLIIRAPRPSVIAKATNAATHPTRTISGNASGRGSGLWANHYQPT